MKSNMCVFAKPFTQPFLYLRGMQMRLIKSHISRHSYMHLNSYGISYAAGAEMVYLACYRFLTYNVNNLFLHILRQAFLQQFVRRPSKQR